MAWKVERWLAEVFPGPGNIYSAYEHLTRRELAIVSAGVLDNALAELLSLRLQDFPGEYEAFLGLNEDGRAPCGSFGARIQLALLLGIITESDASVLRTIKNIRNKFAHRINVDFTDTQVKPLVLSLHDKMREQRNGLIERGHLKATPEKVDEIRPYFDMTPEAGAGLLLSVFSVYQAYFHRLHALVKRIETVRPSGGGS
jgi:hypothetical protein